MLTARANPENYDKDEPYFPFPVPDYRYDQRNEMFKRRTWDKEFLPYGNQLYGKVKYRDTYGYRKLDYALRNAAWSIEYGFAFGVLKSNHGMYSWDHIPEKMKRFVETGEKVAHNPEENTRIIKKAARFLGADMVGACYAHPSLIYSHEMDLMDGIHRPLELPEGCTNAVVMALGMPYDAVRYSPDAISGAATGLGYSRQAVVANMVATFIRGLGYQAIPSGNDTALSIPLAMAAGLGELGRMGLLITRPYGPRVRICKVFTDLPLVFDEYRPFGVAEFCHTCKKCARHCPSQAISFDAPTMEGPSRSNFSGVEKWYINPEKCFTFWAKNWMDCNNCVMVCPFNKPPGFIHNTVRYFIKDWPMFNRLMLWMDDLMGYGKQMLRRDKMFWEKPEL
ncbi:MAG: reductive dehalogenase [Desulfatiglandaceae bacterium]|jgi:epoxyqueuosine reductase